MNSKLDSGSLETPLGARIRFISVRVKQDRGWQEALESVSPQIPMGFRIRRIAALYPPTGTGETEEELILLNSESGLLNWNAALAWADRRSLERTNPRDVFAVGEQYPALNVEYEMKVMSVVATIPCVYSGRSAACCVWWVDTTCEASLRKLGDLSGNRIWYSFKGRPA